MNDSSSYSSLESYIGSMSWEDFEKFCLRFLNSNVKISIERNGKAITKQIISANFHGKSGQPDSGVDIIADVERERWAFQCKRHKNWTKSKTEKAIRDAGGYSANHYFLLVGCSVDEKSHELIRNHSNWTIWGIEDIYAHFLNKVSRFKQKEVLGVNNRLFKQLIPYANTSLVGYKDFFNEDSHESFRHIMPLVGRNQLVQELIQSANKNKVTLLVSKGGEGKSRFLYELAKHHDQKPIPQEVLFFNPHAGESTLDEDFNDEIDRLVVIDDAHRSESISDELIHLVRKAKHTRLVLATRPQGVESINHVLSMHQLLDETNKIQIPELNQKDKKELAKYALGNVHSQHAEHLIELSNGSPFLIIKAGSLIAKELLNWGQWHDKQSFRVAVFQCYESEYLKYLQRVDDETCKRYLRLLSLLSPIKLDNDFFQRAGEFLDLKVYEIQQLSKKIQNAGLLSEGIHNVRVIPDLYSDFLTYEVAYDPEIGLPTFIADVNEEFPEAVGAMLRNLSEATWIATSKGTDCSEVISPLFEKILSNFRNSSFGKRVEILKHWANFSVYLPEETLKLAQYAMGLKEAPKPNNEKTFRFLDEPDYQSVCGGITVMVKPVANFYLAPKKTQALNLLWKLGKTFPLGPFDINSGHPWAVIADVIKYELTKPIQHIMEALDWVDSWVQRPNARSEIQTGKNVLNILLHPCFERFVKCNEWDGHTFGWWEQPIDINKTQMIRDRALDIVEWVIQNLDWKAALESLDILSHAIHRCAPIEINHLMKKEINEYVAGWRPERIKALKLINSLLKKYPCHIEVKYSVRKTLLMDLAYEEDSEFAKEVKKVLGKLNEDFELRLTTIVNSRGGLELDRKTREELKREDWLEQGRQKWADYIEKVAREIIEKYRDPSDAAQLLTKNAKTGLEAGFTAHHNELFQALVKEDTGYAKALAQYFINQDDPTSILSDWFFFLVGLSRMDSIPIRDLLNAALRNPTEQIRTGVIRYFCCRDRGQIKLTLQDRSIIQKALDNPSPKTIARFIDLVSWLDDESAPWGIRMLSTLPHNDLIDKFEQILEAVFPYGTRKALPEEKVVENLLSVAVKSPEISIFNITDQWSQLTNNFPYNVYCFFVDRIKYKQSHPEKKDYRAIPDISRDTINFKNLSKDRNFNEILQTIWEKSSSFEITEGLHDWRKLFHKIVIPKPDFWKPKLLQKISEAVTMDDLHHLRDLISFRGSLIVFRMIDITRLFLEKSISIGGEKGLKRMITWLYDSASPHIRSYSSGNRSSDSDYVESEARKSFMEHKNDELLGNFFQSIIDFEIRRREQNRDPRSSYFDDE